MLGQIRLYDYRCFYRETPATLPLDVGFTSFIGPNNSGKSTLIRSLFDLRPAISNLEGLFSNPNSRAFSSNAPQPILDPSEIITDRKDEARCVVDLIPETKGITGSFVSRASLRFDPSGQHYTVSLFDETNNAIRGGGKDFQILHGAYLRSNVDQVSRDLRPLHRMIQAVQKTMYVGPFRNAINEGAGSYFDTEIGTSFLTQWHQWKTGPRKVNNRAIQLVTDDVKRLIGAETLDIAASVELKTLQITINQRPQKLHELGAGIAQLIQVLGSALVRQPSFIVIDEPEIHLHPALQTEFLTTLGKYASEGVIFATHSMGLARAVSDRCFSIRKNSEGSIVRPFEKTPHYAEFLGSMGIAGLQEIGWDRILLVEGTTDVRTIRQFLRLFDLDRKTVVLPMGGDSLASGSALSELSEILRLGGKFSAIVDSERQSAIGEAKKERMAFQAACKHLNVAVLVTQRRAIENYLTQPAINTAFGEGKYKALGEYDEPSREINAFWGKSRNWLAAGAMTKKEILETDLGEFLKSLQAD